MYLELYMTRIDRILKIVFFFLIKEEKCKEIIYRMGIGTAERVTGRKARGLQTEETACKCQTFLSLLSSRRKQTSDIFSFSIQI